MRTTFFVFAGAALSFAVLACGSEGQRGPNVQESTSAIEDAVPGSYVLTPFGLIHQSCVHTLDDGADVAAQNVAPCAHASIAAKDAPQDANGWFAWEEWNSDAPLARIVADWTVPAAPTVSNGGTVFFFPGFEPTSRSVIMQPVLQYGASAAGGGDSWGIASWNCCVEGNAFASKVVAVTAGDTIHGAVVGNKCTASGACASWTITTHDLTSGKKSTLVTPATTEPSTRALGAVLEGYNLTSCAELPAGPTTFRKISLSDVNGKAVTPAWSANTSTITPDCGYGATSSGVTSIALTY